MASDGSALAVGIKLIAADSRNQPDQLLGADLAQSPGLQGAPSRLPSHRKANTTKTQMHVE